MKTNKIIKKSISYLKILDKEYLKGTLSISEEEYRLTASHVTIMAHNHPYIEERKKNKSLWKEKMGTTLNRKGYEMLIKENLEWLLNQPRSLERNHIEDILNESINLLYGDKKRGEPEGTVLPK